MTITLTICTVSFAADEASFQNAFMLVAEKAGPAVVTINIEKTTKVKVTGPVVKLQQIPSKGEQDEFLRSFFGPGGERELKQQGFGSGFIISKDGYILTNHHVVEGAEKISVNLPDGRAFPVEWVATDKISDLSLLKISAPNLPYAELGDSDTVRAGQWVAALGNPLGNMIKSAQPTVTVGVVSALHRSLPIASKTVQRRYVNLIQTDAAINIGNSGGPLCDINGKVIGINVAMFSQGGANTGINFAIPVNSAKRVLEQLMKGKDVIYGWIGIGLQEVTPSIAESLKLRNAEGAVVAQIAEGSPAAAGGLSLGDIVKTYNGTNVIDVKDFITKINYSKPGDVAEIGIVRKGREIRLKVTIGIEAAAKR